MDADLKHVRLSVAVHAIAGIAVAYLSVLVSLPLAAAAGVGVLLAVGYPLERWAGKRGLSWWFGNGIIIYLLLWLVGWIYLTNLPL